MEECVPSQYFCLMIEEEKKCFRLLMREIKIVQ